MMPFIVFSFHYEQEKSQFNNGFLYGTVYFMMFFVTKV